MPSWCDSKLVIAHVLMPSRQAQTPAWHPRTMGLQMTPQAPQLVGSAVGSRHTLPQGIVTPVHRQTPAMHAALGPHGTMQSGVFRQLQYDSTQGGPASGASTPSSTPSPESSPAVASNPPASMAASRPAPPSDPAPESTPGAPGAGIVGPSAVQATARHAHARSKARYRGEAIGDPYRSRFPGAD